MNYWLVKSEPETYSWDDLVKKGRDHWDGVRNYQARNNLKLMKVDDKVLFYHSGEEKQVVGLARVVREFYPDPTIDDDRWVAVDLVSVEKLKKSITLAHIKSDSALTGLPLIKNTRLSVMPVEKKHFDHIIGLSILE
ncbi:MAG: EVE domain-containing protein [Cyclobacteriaceae bacterium]|nr:EVE domain-containing protein [Cyclobacteriaceae bacterium]